MRTLLIVIVLSAVVAMASIPFVMAENEGVTKLELVAWNGGREVVLTLNMHPQGIAALIFSIALCLTVFCSFAAIIHDGNKYGLWWQQKKR